MRKIIGRIVIVIGSLWAVIPVIAQWVQANQDERFLMLMHIFPAGFLLTVGLALIYAWNADTFAHLRLNRDTAMKLIGMSINAKQQSEATRQAISTRNRGAAEGMLLADMVRGLIDEKSVPQIEGYRSKFLDVVDGEVSNVT